MKYLIYLCLILGFSTYQVRAFSDIEQNWYKNAILELKEDGIINGFEDGTYLPESTITRAEILKIILSSTDIKTISPEESCFLDVDANDWQAKYVCTWYENGITKGYEDGTFRPNGTVTFLEAIAFTARAFELEIEDIWEENEWYEKYQVFAHTHNIFPVHAYSKNTFITRGQAAQLIFNMRQHADGEKLDYKSIGCDINPDLKSGSYSLDIAGKQRKYLLYVPSGMRKNKEMNLVIAFHGRTNNNEMVRDYMQLGGWNYGYKQNDFIVAYPQWLGAGLYSWSQYENIEFFDALITEISEKLCVNRDKIFTVGHSLGSYMSNKVSCQRGDVIRAMAGIASDGFNGDCSWPVSSLITHLPWDHLAAYSGWERAYRLKSEQNFCWNSEKTITLWDIRSCTQKTSCSPENTVVFCNSYSTYGNDPHSWPKEWSDDILDFFRNIDEYSKT